VRRVARWLRGGCRVAGCHRDCPPSGLNGSPNPDKLACHEVSAGRNRRDLGLIEVTRSVRAVGNIRPICERRFGLPASVSKALAVCLAGRGLQRATSSRHILEALRVSRAVKHVLHLIVQEAGKDG